MPAASLLDCLWRRRRSQTLTPPPALPLPEAAVQIVPAKEAPSVGRVERQPGVEAAPGAGLVSGSKVLPSVGQVVRQPAWRQLQGAKRVTAEMKELAAQIKSGDFKQISDLQNVNGNVYTWRFHVKNFDDTLKGGRDINADLKKLNARHQQDCLVMEIVFPPENQYPSEPFFLRVVSPRCKWYTGHVTAGGSICLEVLTNTSSTTGWKSEYCVESMLHMIFHSMITCERMVIRTATGPGGTSGPLRIDLNGDWGVPVMQEYSMYEAQSGFQRALSHHKQNGW